LFNSKLRISIFDNLPKNYILRKTCGFAQIAPKNLRKTKILFHVQLSEIKYFRFCADCAKNSAKPRKTHCVPCAKIAQNFAKKKFARK